MQSNVVSNGCRNFFHCKWESFYYLGKCNLQGQLVNKIVIASATNCLCIMGMVKEQFTPWVSYIESKILPRPSEVKCTETENNTVFIIQWNLFIRERERHTEVYWPQERKLSRKPVKVNSEDSIGKTSPSLSTSLNETIPKHVHLYLPV